MILAGLRTNQLHQLLALAQMPHFPLNNGQQLPAIGENGSPPVHACARPVFAPFFPGCVRGCPLPPIYTFCTGRCSEGAAAHAHLECYAVIVDLQTQSD